MESTRLERVEEKLDALTETLTNVRLDIGKALAVGEKVAKLETKVEDLERFRVYLMGAAAGIGLLTGAGGHYVARMLDAPAAVARAEAK